MHHNQIKHGEDVELIVIDTPLGNVTVQLTRTWNADCPAPGCPDVLEVIDVPSGSIAIPPRLDTPENGLAHIELRRYQGV